MFTPCGSRKSECCQSGKVKGENGVSITRAVIGRRLRGQCSRPAGHEKASVVKAENEDSGTFLSLVCEEFFHQRRCFIGTDTAHNLGLGMEYVGCIAAVAAFLILGTIDKLA